MFNANEINNLKNKERVAAENYLHNLTDFVKWTTTLTLAAVVWISTAITSFEGFAQTVGITSLLALLVSLVFAIISIKRVFDGSSNEWDLSRATHTIALLELFEKINPSADFIEKRRKKANELLEKSLEQNTKYYGTSYFNAPVTLHSISLCIGVALYAVSQLISSR